jgi:ethanolamine utilization protein EutN
MQLGEVVGSVVCTRKVPVWEGQRLRLVQPLDQEGRASGLPVVALDVVSSGEGQRVFFVKGREAAQAIADANNPADAAIVVLVDRIERADSVTGA